MDRRILVLNLVFVALIVTAAVRLIDRWNAYEAEHQVDAIQPEAEIDPPEIPAEAGDGGSEPQDWSTVSGLNPFSPDRNDIPIVAPLPPPEPEEQPVPASLTLPMIRGTMLLGEDRIALLAPRSPLLPDQPVRVGETFEGWRLEEIGRKHVVVAAGGARRTVEMNDPTAPVLRENVRTRASAAPAPAPVPAPAPAAAPTPAPTASTAPAEPAVPRTRTIQTPFGERTIPIDE